MAEVDFEDFHKPLDTKRPDGDNQALRYMWCEALTVSASIYQNRRQLPSNCRHVLFQLVLDAEGYLLFESNDLHYSSTTSWSSVRAPILHHKSQLFYLARSHAFGPAPNVTWENLC